MDDSTFDTLTRSFAVSSRRAVFSALGAAILPALIAHDGSGDGLAKPKHRGNRGHEAGSVRASGKGKKKKKKKKKKKGGRGREPVCTEELGSEATCAPPGCTPNGGGCVEGGPPCCGCCAVEAGGELALGTCHSGTSRDFCGPAAGSCDKCIDEGEICEDHRCCIANYLPCANSSQCCAPGCVGSGAEKVCCPSGRYCLSNARGEECCEPGQTCHFERGCECGEAECAKEQGCCLNGHCQPGVGHDACGIDGKACKNCLPNGTCVKGQCASVCPHNQNYCANTSDGRTNECLWTVGYNCRHSSGAISGCGYPGASHCCANTAGSPCGFLSGSEPACPPGATVTPAVTCLG